MKKIKMLDLLLMVLIFFVMILVIVNVPIIARYKNNGNLIINEVVSNNNNIVVNSDGNHYDFIEIYNGYDYDINLEGYYLSDDNFNLKKWKFPDVIIKSKEYLLVYASGLDKYEDGILHTNFKLSKSGEVLTLSDKKVNVLSKIYFKEMGSDISYGYNGKDYVYFYSPTPGMENSGEFSKEVIKDIKDSNTNLKITNYTLGSIPIIKIKNEEDNDINLEGYYLSDTLNNKYKYKFPSIVIKSKDTITIYASGLNKYEDGVLHTNFELTNEDSNIVLSDDKKGKIDVLNLKNTSSNKISKDVQINEVSSIGIEAIELKNLTDNDINLNNYKIVDKSGKEASLKNLIIKANSYVVLYGSDRYYYSNGNIYTGFHIGNSDEKLYLYKDEILIDEFNVGRLTSGVSVGRNNNNERVYYNNLTIGSKNSSNFYIGYNPKVNFSINGGYVEKGTYISLYVDSNSDIYYTLDGSFPTTSSIKYKDPIKIDTTTTIKAISYSKDYLQSEVSSRTFIVGRKHDLPIVSISTNNYNLYGSNGILTNYKQNVNKIISFELYQENGNLGVSFIGDTKLSGMDSREQPQKSMSIYLRKEYGLKEVTYPFFKDSSVNTYSSLLLRNAGEDPKNIRIMDAVLTRTLKGNMDIDIQDYQPVVVYINGEYYGLYNLREKLNEDYLVSRYGLEKGSIDFIKYSTATKGSTKDYDNLINYINTHDASDSKVYEYLKTQIDMQELINYVIAETYYGNTDLGNIRYWKSKDSGKWRWMLYDLDWSMWNSDVNIGYPVVGGDVPAVTYLNSLFVITRSLYKNKEFKDLYLTTLSYHLKNTFNPDRMNKIVDELAKEIENEMPYHIERWGNEYSGLTSMDRWKSNLNSFKNMISSRYNTVLRRLKNDFHLTNEEYNKYFGDVL